MKWILAIGLFVACAAQEYKLETVQLPPPPSESGTNPRIIGGIPSNIQRYPYAVQVLHLNQLGCGGSLITQRHVLSAAHCFFDDRGRPTDPRDYSVRVGATDLGRGGSVHSVSVVITSENYNRPMIRDNDIAVMLLSSAVKLGANVAIARIPRQGDEVPDNSPVTHVGWGLIHPLATDPSPTLLEVDILTVNAAQCREQYRMLGELTGNSYPITQTMMCSGLLGIGGKDACQGDSGGPLVYQGIVVGVTSWGYGCGEPLFPGVNSKVSANTNWINTTVTRYNASPPVGNISAVLLAASIITSMILSSNK